MTLRLVSVVVATAALASVAAVAGAHPFTNTSSIPVNEPATILIQIPAEGASPMIGIDIEIPDGFDLDRSGPPQGWNAEMAADVVRFRGPEIGLGSFAVVNLGGKATRRGKFAFPLVIHNADGTTIEWRGGEASIRPPIIVFAGVGPLDDSSESSPALRVGLGLVLGIAVVGILIVLRRRGVI